MSNLNLFKPEKIKTVSRRNDKIAAKMRECFSKALTRGDFPILPAHENESKLPSIVTITYIDLSPDLRNATVYYVPLGGLHKEECAIFFKLQTHYFKDLIAKKLNLRYIPELLFKLDGAFEYSGKIDKLLKNG